MPEFGPDGVRSPWEVTSLMLAGRRLGRAEAGGRCLFPVYDRQQPPASPGGQAPPAA